MEVKILYLLTFCMMYIPVFEREYRLKSLIIFIQDTNKEIHKFFIHIHFVIFLTSKKELKINLYSVNNIKNTEISKHFTNSYNDWNYFQRGCMDKWRSGDF